MTDKLVELASKMRVYGLWGGYGKVTSKDGRFVLGPPPGTNQRDWTAEVMYLDDQPVGYWIGANDQLVYGVGAGSKVSITEDELYSRMESLFLDWLEAPKLDYVPDPEADTYITRFLDPLLLVGLRDIEKTQWEIDIFLVNVGKKQAQVTIKATGQHFCFIDNLGGTVCCDGSEAYTPHILIGILTYLKAQVREWWKNNEAIAKEPLMAVCDPEGLWTVSYHWIAWALIKGHLGNTPTAPITHAIMSLERLYCKPEHEQVICEKSKTNPLQFKLYQITKTLVKPDEGESSES